MLDVYGYPELRYSWQKAVFDVFTEFDPDSLPDRVKTAERAIAARLKQNGSPDPDERSAISDALRALKVLLPD